MKPSVWRVQYLRPGDQHKVVKFLRGEGSEHQARAALRTVPKGSTHLQIANLVDGQWVTHPTERDTARHV